MHTVVLKFYLSSFFYSFFFQIHRNQHDLLNNDKHAFADSRRTNKVRIFLAALSLKVFTYVTHFFIVRFVFVLTLFWKIV